ncbi:MAG: hypothetical protein NT067_00120 [Candidatus Diapherotrites archaeon]|nr:hypothetical protein [Candidatus Diapherotrites archaeon]
MQEKLPGFREARDLAELNAALQDSKAKAVLFRSGRSKSFDLQALKKAAESGKEFYVSFEEFLEGDQRERKELFKNFFSLFKIAKKAKLQIKILGSGKESEEELEFFGEFLGKGGKHG